SYNWLTYVYAQQGRYAQAEELVNRLRQTRQQHGADSVRFYDATLALFIVETERWDLAAKLFSEQTTAPASADEHAGHSATAAPAKPAYLLPQGRGASLPLFVRALSAASTGAPEAEKLLTEIRAQRQQSKDNYEAKGLEI